MRVLIICWLGIAGVALGQVSPPQLGWLPDRTSIRMVYGIPAAAAVGPKLVLDRDLAQIAVSASDYALVSARKTGEVSIYTSSNGLTPLEGAAPAPDLVVLSPRGSSAALWYSSTHQAQVVTGLPNAPQIQQRDTSFLDSAPDALAVSDDGAWLSGVWAGSVLLFGPNGELDRLPMENVAAIAFFQGTHDLASAGSDGLKMVTGVGGFAVVSTLLASADASLHPIGVATTSDNLTLVLADRSGSVTTINIASGAATAYDCGCQPQGLFGMGSTTFRLTGLQDGAIKLFSLTHDLTHDIASGEILFAPLARTEPAEGAAQ